MGRPHAQDGLEPGILREHVRVAVAALSLGFLDEHDVESALLRAVRLGASEVASVWGRMLTSEQLHVIENCWGKPIPSVIATQLGLGQHQAPFYHRTVRAAAADDARQPRYQRIRVIGAGGAGEVHECMDALLQRPVAMKLIHPDAAIPGDQREALDREARITSSLEHPNIIPIYDAGSAEDGQSYYVMRCVEQSTLHDALDKLRSRDADAERAYPLARRLRHFMQVCDAIEYAHSRGVIHCDLKPDNILLGPFGEVLIVDWGLAYEIATSSGLRGGTPGYMAPEQTSPVAGAIGPHTDVFALGAILYELVSLSPVFTGTASEVLAQLQAGAIPALRRAAGRPVPAELEAICARCLCPDPRARFASARAIASAIEGYLEGTRERERRAADAERLVAEADELAARYFEFIDQCAEQEADVEALRRRIRPWAAIEAKQALWKAEDLIQVTESLRVRTLQAAVASYEQALDAVADFAAARRGLARLYGSELERARRRRDTLNELYFEALVGQHDDGNVLGAMRSDGALRVECADPAAALSLEAIVERQRRLRPAGRRAPLTPGTVSVAPGPYRVIAEAAGRPPVVYPVLVQPGREHRVSVDTELAAALAEDELLLPAGVALLGGGAGGPPHELFVGTCAIRRWPVTFAEYLAFVAEAAPGGPRLQHLAPTSRGGQPYFRRDDAGAWIPAHLPPLEREQDPMRLPAFGIDALAAQAYARWLSERTGRRYRLPTALEWEKAARGVDGRRYPWGDRFDAGFCKMRESRDGLPRPEEIGAFSADESPYGVRDMAGGVAEWVTPHAGDGSPDPGPARYASRGGAWCDWADDCRVDVGRTYFALERSARLGFRLVRELSS